MVEAVMHQAVEAGLAQPRLLGGTVPAVVAGALRERKRS